MNRELTPKDEKGELDYESIYALDIPLINEQFQALFRGEEVELPKYNFQTGKSEKGGRRLQLADNNVLVVEGIHALNPQLTDRIPAAQKFKIYASALTTILLDDHNYIPTTDNRLLRRIIRDNKYRGCTAQETIHRWPCRGEQVDIPVPGKCRCNVQYSNAFRAGGYQSTGRTVVGDGAGELRRIRRSLSVAQVFEVFLSDSES